MARYTKIHSNYVLSKKHRHTTKGTIFERDWVTIGERHMLDPGKRPIYYDGNFLFTDNSRVNSRKRYNYSEDIASFTYDDVSDAKAPANNVVVNFRSDDMRDYAYYGSCRELVRASAENILKWFPCNVKAEDGQLMDNEGTSTGKYRLRNDFGVDFIHSVATLEGDINIMRYVRDSWENYTVNGLDVASYAVQMLEFDHKCLANNEGKLVCNIVLTDILENVYKMYGYYINGNVEFASETSDFELKPKDKIIEDYFDGLEGFEALMLQRDTNPRYTMRLATPIEKPEDEGYTKVYREYTWPSNGYCITANDGAYTTYISALYTIADIFDNEWCDNLYRNMTHEAIKNFDWTYTRDYAEGEEDDYVFGGEIMTDFLRVTGRMFDDIKRSIDGIRLTNRITRDGLNNVSDAEVSDKVELSGWDVVTIIPRPTENGAASLGEIKIDTYSAYTYPVDKETVKVLAQLPDADGNKVYTNHRCTHTKWFTGVADDGYTASDVELDFMRQLNLSSKHICKSKGTVHSLEMMFALFGLGRGVDYEIGEGYKTIKPKELFFMSVTGDWIDNSDVTSRIIGDLSHDNFYDPEDSFDAVPFGIVTVNNHKYLIPHFSNDRKKLTNYMQFQCAGGWGKHGTDRNDKFTYTETLSYLKVIDSIGELLNLNPREVTTGDVYYVYDLVGIGKEAETIELEPDAILPPSHFFVLLNAMSPEKYSSWKCIIMDPDDDDFVDDEYYRKALYLDRLISINTGNNPHVGYGRYDMGYLYDTYMESPFSRLLSTKSIAPSDYDIMMSDEYNFMMDRYGVLDDAGTHTYDKYSGQERTEEQTEDMWDCEKVKSVDLLEKWYEIGDESIAEKIMNRYYINDKTLVIKNLHEGNKTFCSYFMNVIFPFIAQVIPSTAILRLDGFMETEPYEPATEESNMGYYTLPLDYE